MTDGQHFYDGKQAREYKLKNMLEGMVLTLIEELPLETRQSMFSQQDGTLFHVFHKARQLLNAHFCRRWAWCMGPVQRTMQSLSLVYKNSICGALWRILHTEMNHSLLTIFGQNRKQQHESHPRRDPECNGRCYTEASDVHWGRRQSLSTLCEILTGLH